MSQDRHQGLQAHAGVGERGGVSVAQLVGHDPQRRPVGAGEPGELDGLVQAVGAENSSTSCDLGIFVDQPAYWIDPHDAYVGRRSGRWDGSKR